MMIQSVKNLIPCTVAVMIAIAIGPARGQDYGFEDKAIEPAETSGYVGDTPVSNEGSVVEMGMGMGRSYGRPDLFYNYFTQGYANQVNAQMYLSPSPVPPNVGHTFYTYQPSYPHHMLYSHVDRYHRYYDNGRGMNRTRAMYYSPPVRQAVSNVYWNFLRLPR